MFEAVLEYFEVVDEVDFESGLPFDFLERHFAWVGSVEEVAVDVAGAELFDVGEVGVQSVVDPVDDVVPGGEIATLLHCR